MRLSVCSYIRTLIENGGVFVETPHTVEIAQPAEDRVQASSLLPRSLHKLCKPPHDQILQEHQTQSMGIEHLALLPRNESILWGTERERERERVDK